MTDMGAAKIMIGHKLKRLRKELGLSQALMAEELGISGSYLNLLENNMRPVTVQLLFKLGQTYDIDLKDMAEDDSAQMTAQLIEIFADPALREQPISRRDMQQMAQNQPLAAQAIIALHDAYEAMKSAAQQGTDGLETRSLPRPVEAVRRFLEQADNHFPTLESAADSCRHKIALSHGHAFSQLSQFLETNYNLKARIMPVHVMGHLLRHHDLHRSQLLLSELLEEPQRIFQLASQIALLGYRKDIQDIIDSSAIHDSEARQLLLITLAGYFAGALLMPYDSFLKSAQDSRYDLDILCKRFTASFEQVCHRLTTLNRPNQKGIPFFFLRVNEAGYISKRLSGAGVEFARHGGACGRWVPHHAFRNPGIIHTQIAELEEGQTFFTMAKTVSQARTAPAHHGTPAITIALGCDIKHAKEIGHADPLLAAKTPLVTPIGLGCQLCERTDCQHRGAPPLGRHLRFDAYRRHSAMFDFGS